MADLLDHFPVGENPRDSQVQILRGIETALQQNKKFILIQAPTGSGKSFVAATLANYSKPPSASYSSLAQNSRLTAKAPTGEYENEEELDQEKAFGCAVLTVTKQLQDQYDSLFSNANILKGRQNYTCQLDEDFMCDMAPCFLLPMLASKCISERKCSYANARDAALSSRFAVFNYSMYFSLPTFLQKRQILICDEASEIEDQIVKFFSCEINYDLLKKFDVKMEKAISNDVSYIHKWINDLSNILLQQVEKIRLLVNRLKKDKRVRMGLMGKLRFLSDLHERLALILSHWHLTEYLIEYNGTQIKFIPLHVNLLAKKIFDKSDIVILMSGTLIDPNTFAKTLGIDDFVFIEADSEFDPAKSPIYCMSKYNLNYKTLDKYLPELTQIVLRICAQYPNDKGIVHTHTFKITEALKNSINGDKRFLIREPGITNEYLVNAHKMSEEKTVIISPSLGFGTDLSDDYGRFSVIMKTPFLPLNEGRIKILAERNPKWYQMRALINLIQMCGRTTRSKDDYSDTYILDATAIDLIKRNQNHIPKYYLKRIK